MPALYHSKKTDCAAVLEPLEAVQQKAHAAGVELSFDRAFMTPLSFENDQATAVFSCGGFNL